jgi:Crinkler effector protein N-terminal domain
MLEPYELFVLVLGDLPPSMHTFPMTLPASDSVGKLREQVCAQNQNSLKAIDAKELVLWKVLPLCSSHRIIY